MSVLHSAPELAMVYIAERPGTSQQILIDAVTAGRSNWPRSTAACAPGDPRRLAAMCLLITQSTVQSAQMVEPILGADALAAELAHALNGYLAAMNPAPVRQRAQPRAPQRRTRRARGRRHRSTCW